MAPPLDALLLVKLQFKTVISSPIKNNAPPSSQELFSNREFKI